MAVLAVASLMSSACTVMDVYEGQKVQEAQVGVHMAKADGIVPAAVGDAEYALRFWYGDIKDSWGMSLDTNSDPVAEGNVDYYNYAGGEDYPVMDAEGNPLTYPGDGSPVYAIGYYPAGKLESSRTDGKDDWQSLMIKTIEGDRLTKPGLVDVCVTDIEQGSEMSPFTFSEDNELQFRHTQVKLTFQYQRSLNLNGRVAQIWVTIPQEHIANKWTFTEEAAGVGTYVPSADYDNKDVRTSLIVTSTEDWYQSTGGKTYYMYYSYFDDPANPSNYTTTSMKDCYVLPSEVMFGPKEIDGTMVQHITFNLNAVIISSDANIPNTRVNGDVSVPLRTKDGQMWTETVKAGDAFDILIIIEQNRLVLLAEKGKWEKGGYFTVPLNPNTPNP